MMNLTPDTKFRITLGVALSAITGAAWGGWQFNGTLAAINQSIKDTAMQVNTRIDGVDAKIVALTESVTDRWTKTDAAEWVLRCQILNPALRLPDPRNPMRDLIPQQQNTRADWTTSKGPPWH